MPKVGIQEDQQDQAWGPGLGNTRKRQRPQAPSKHRSQQSGFINGLGVTQVTLTKV